MFVVCQEMGYDYWEYRAQPYSWIELCVDHIQVKGEVAKQMSRNS